MSRVGAGLLAAAGAALACAAGVGMYFESSPYLSAGPEPQEAFAAIEDGSYRDGLSVWAHSVTMRSCLLALGSVYGRVQPTARRAAVAENCKAMASRATASNPGLGLGWYVQQSASPPVEDWPGFNSAARIGQSVTPSEQWLAELRVTLNERYFDHLDDAALQAHEADLALLVQSRRGIASIATRYVADTKFRERITRIVEQLGPEVRATFLDSVRAAAGQ